MPAGSPWLSPMAQCRRTLNNRRNQFRSDILVLARGVLYHRTEIYLFIYFLVANLAQHDLLHSSVGSDFGHLAMTVGLTAARGSFPCEFTHSVAKINHISLQLLATVFAFHFLLTRSPAAPLSLRGSLA